jgi:hypothetical protein
VAHGHGSVEVMRWQGIREFIGQEEHFSREEFTLA